jgi:outer membrane autotransporter protein
MNSLSDVSGSGGFSRYQADIWGGSAGVQVRLDRRSFVGAAGGWARTDLDLARKLGSGAVRNRYGSLFGSVWGERWYGQALLSYGNQSFADKRAISVGAISETAKSDHDGYSLAASVDVGFEAVSGRGWSAVPYGALEYAYLSEDGYRERGTGSLLLVVEDRDTNSLVSELGFRLTSQQKLWNVLVPEFTAGWRHDYDVDERTLAGHFRDGPLSPFSLSGRNIERNVGRFGGVLRFQGDGAFNVVVQSQALIGNDATDYLLSLRLGYLY